MIANVLKAALATLITVVIVAAIMCALSFINRAPDSFLIVGGGVGLVLLVAVVWRFLSDCYPDLFTRNKKLQ